MLSLCAFVLVPTVFAARHDYADTSVRIVGGKLASTGKYSAYGIPVGDVLCGATLIARDIMVSAAHCKGAFTAGPSAVALGGSSASSSNAKEIIGVQYEAVHPDYDESTASNDIMLVVLAQPSKSEPVKLNRERNYPIDGQAVTAIGFGNTAEGGHVSERLQEVAINVVSSSICTSAYKKVDINVANEIMLCTGVYGGGKGSCQGDSGGPIFDDDGGLVGVVSWGKGCASGEFPGVNVRVSSYVQFLEDSICAFSNHPPPFCNDGAQSVPPDSWFSNVTSPGNDWTASSQVLASANNQTSTSEWDVPRPLLVTHNDPFGLSSSDSLKNSTGFASSFEWHNTTSDSEFGTLVLENTTMLDVNDTIAAIGTSASESRTEHFSSSFGDGPNATHVNATEGDDQHDQQLSSPFGNDSNVTDVNTTQADDQHPGNNTSSSPLTEHTIPLNASALPLTEDPISLNASNVNDTIPLNASALPLTEDPIPLNTSGDDGIGGNATHHPSASPTSALLEKRTSPDTDAITNSMSPNVSPSEELSLPKLDSSAPNMLLLQGLLTLHILQFAIQ